MRQMIGDIFGSIKNKITGGAGTRAAATASPGLLYMFFHHFFPDGSPEPQTTVNYLRSLGVPETVVQKAVSAMDAFEYMHDHWGVSYHDGADISDTNSATRQALRMFLGMEPQKYLSMVVPLPSNAPRISGFDGVGDYVGSVLSTLSSLIPSGGGTSSGNISNLVSTAAGAALSATPAGAVTTGVLAAIQSIANQVITFNTPPQTWYNAYPNPDDWAGWTKYVVKPGTYVPSEHDPLGITGYDGQRMGAAQLATIQPSNGLSLNTGAPTQAGMSTGNKLGMILLVGALAGGAWYFLKDHKRK